MYIQLLVCGFIILIIAFIVNKLMSLIRKKLKNKCKRFILDFCFIVELYLVLIISYFCLKSYLVKFSKLKIYQINYLLLIFMLIILIFMLERNLKLINKIIKI